MNFPLDATLLNQRLAAYLKLLRHETNITRKDLAGQMSVEYSVISHFERNLQGLDVGEFVVMCNILNQNPVVVLQTVLE
jgi:transcriptional regulator with XRE-family HTH domain